MNNLQTTMTQYLEFCQYQKRLDTKTLKAYRIDLQQFTDQMTVDSFPLPRTCHTAENHSLTYYRRASFCHVYRKISKQISLSAKMYYPRHAVIDFYSPQV